MKYLNDIIYSPTLAVGNAYIDYEISIASPYWYSPFYNSIYRGRYFSYKADQKIYLNDILSSYRDNYSWMSYDKVLEALNNKANDGLISVKAEDQTKTMGRVKINYGNGSQIDEKNVNLCFLDKGSYGKSSYDYMSRISSTRTTPDSFNVLEYRYNLIPRIPITNVEDSQFFLGGVFGVSRAWRNYSEIDGDGLFRVVILDEDKEVITGSAVDRQDEVVYELTAPITSIILTGYIFDGRTPGDFDNSGFARHYIAVAPAHYVDDELDATDATSPIILAQYDECNADYYLIWCDRTGGYQCQPFHKKSTFTENITTTVITDTLDQSRPMLKTVENTWTLNSDWLTFDEYKAYESIFVSPYTYLYDVKNNELTPVLCNEKKWEEKKKQNDRKPFNLKLTLVENRPQNIQY